MWKFCDQSRFNFKSQGTEKIELLSQRIDGSINLTYGGLITVYYKYKEILLFALLDVKLWLKAEAHNQKH